MGLFNSIFGDSEHKDTQQNSLVWNDLTELKQLENLIPESSVYPVLIFKHSTRCAISRMSLKNFENEYKLPENDAKMYFLDLLKHRDISNAVAERFGVWHESPQLLMIKNGKAVYHRSHSDISAEDVSAEIGK